LILLLAVLLVGAGAAAAQAPAPAGAGEASGAASPAPGAAQRFDRMTAPSFELGNPKARVTLVEYASDTCPHCARFAAEVFPEFKKTYVDTGKVKYEFREFPTDPVQLSAAGFILARCAGRDKYFDVVNALFKAQTTSATGLDFLMAGAKVAGFSEDQLKACLNDPAALQELNARVKTAQEVEKVDGTPTFILNGKPLSPGEKSFKDLEDAIDPLLAAERSPHRRKA
jgi:protein-disulfide isomerase